MIWSADESAFKTEWLHFRPGAVPLGWMLRQSEAEPWLRLHALPGSKRYAENARERHLILGRANWLATLLLGTNEPCWQVAIVSEDRSNIGCCYEKEEDFSWHLRATAMIWRANEQNGQLAAIADDTSRMLWMNRKTGRIFAPYDGGFDLFPMDSAEVDLIASRRKSWLSAHPGGL